MNDGTRAWLEELLPSGNDGAILKQAVYGWFKFADTPFANAIRTGNIHSLIALLRCNPSQIHQCMTNTKALCFAVRCEQLEVVQFFMRYLMSERLYAIICDTTDCTALHHAMYNGSLPTVRCIVDAYPQTLGVRGGEETNTPFECVLEHNQSQYLDYFLSVLSDTDVRQFAKRAFHVILDTDVAERIHNIDSTLIDELDCGRTAAQSAVRRKNGAMLYFILRISPNQIDDSCFAYAVNHQNVYQLEYMLSQKPDLTGVHTLLHTIARNIRKPHIILNVLSHTNDMSARDMCGKTPYEVAVYVDNPHAMEAYEPFLTVGDIFDTHMQFKTKPNTRVTHQLTQQCIVLDTYLLPELNVIVKSFIQHQNTKRKLDTQ